MMMIQVTNQTEMLEIGDVFLHQETNLTQSDVEHMDEFDKYYETRELINDWNKLPKQEIENKKIALEIQGFNTNII
jgi:hypothetical protein